MGVTSSCLGRLVWLPSRAGVWELLIHSTHNGDDAPKKRLLLFHAMHNNNDAAMAVKDFVEEGLASLKLQC
jgi:hypothetical protein